MQWKDYRKKYLNYYFLKFKKFQGESVKYKSAITNKLEGGGGQTALPAYLGWTGKVYLD